MNGQHPLVLALVSIALSVAAQFMLKAGMSSAAARELLAQPMALRSAWSLLSNGHILLGFALYGLGAVVWLSVLSRWDVSKAYPLVGLGFVATLFIGAMAGENVSATRYLGVALICAGVWLVSRS